MLPQKLTAAALLRSVWPGSHRALAERNPAFADLAGSFDAPPAGSGRFKEELLEDYEAVLETVKKQTPFVFNGEEGDCLFFDARTFHAASENHSAKLRLALFHNFGLADANARL